MENTFINLECGVLYENAIWGMHLYSNDLFKVNIEDGRIEHVYTFKQLKNESHLLHKIIESKGKLILIPGISPYIVVYDTKSGEEKYFEYRSNCKNFAKFSSFYMVDNNVYFFPAEESYILKIDLGTMEDQYLSVPLIEGMEHVRFGRGSIKTDDSFLIPCANSNKFLKIQEHTDESKWIETGLDLPVKCIANTYNGDYVLLTNNQIWKWNIEKIENIFSLEEEYIEIVGYKNNIWLIPYGKNKFLQYNIGTKELKRFDFPEHYQLENSVVRITNSKVPIYKDVVKNKDHFYIVPRFSNSIIKVNLKNNSFSCKKMFTDRNTEKIIIRSKMKSKGNIEEKDVDLKDYFALFNELSVYDRSENPYLEIGHKIYQSIVNF